jgi:hypothetical protein
MLDEGALLTICFLLLEVTPEIAGSRPSAPPNRLSTSRRKAAFVLQWITRRVAATTSGSGARLLRCARSISFPGIGVGCEGI